MAGVAVLGFEAFGVQGLGVLSVPEASLDPALKAVIRFWTSTQGNLRVKMLWVGLLGGVVLYILSGKSESSSPCSEVCSRHFEVFRLVKGGWGPGEWGGVGVF